MKTITAALKAHIQGEVTTVCVCIALTRRDKGVFCMTDHDEIVVVNTQRYLPYNSFSRMSIANTATLEVDSVEIDGILNSDALARQDIGSGLFDFAEVDVFLVNYNAPDDGQMSLRRGWIGEIEMNEDGTFHAEVRGLSQVFTYRLGDPYEPECDADLGDRRCRIGLDPDFWKAATPYRAGDYIIGHIDPASGYVNASILNADFSDQTEGDTVRNATGWITYGGLDARFHFSAGWHGFTSPPLGGLFAGLTDAIATNDTTRGGMYQDVDLVASGLNTTDIDTGSCRCSFTGFVAVDSEDGRVELRLHSIDANGVTKTIWDSGLHAYAINRWITLGTDSTLIPAGTRKVRVDFYGQKNSSEGWGSAFGGCTLAFNDPNGTFNSDDQASGVMFQAQTAGVTSSTEPLFSVLLGATYTDGTVTWKCIQSFKDVTTVTAVTSNQVFAATLPHVADYYDGGLLIWETGANAGRAMDLKTWDGTDIVLFQRTFYPIVIGDRFVIHPGCDKRRPTCISKFNNLLNFRGFPDVPGQDAYLQSPQTPVQ